MVVVRAGTFIVVVTPGSTTVLVLTNEYADQPPTSMV
jgi:hypothetical protein